MTERVVNGVRIDKFLQLEGQVVEPVPETERERYVYWRAAHLGNIALNFINGKRYLNAREINSTHFWTDYGKAVNTARELAEPDSRLINQFGKIHRREFSLLASISPDFAYPAIVMALNESFNNGLELEDTRTINPLSAGLDELFDTRTWDQLHSPGGGFVLHGRLTAAMLDPYSRQAIREIFGPVE